MAHRSTPGAHCRLGPFTLDTASAALLHAGAPLPLGRRAVAVLQTLLRRHGEIVTKDELYETAWPGQAVEESNLTVQISQLRRTMRSVAAESEGWIETLPRRGYRFTGPVEWQRLAAPREPAVSNLPITVPLHFAGREAELAAIHAALVAQPGAAPDARHAIVALHGLRGVGKTILAAAYAELHAGEHRVTWWLRAETVPTLVADLAALAIRLGHVKPDVSEESALAASLAMLRKDGEGVLLIYDNAPDAKSVRPYLPREGAARIIITSNTQAWRAHATPLALSLWPPQTGAAFLLARTGRAAERADAEALSRALEGLPLAHEQAAAYIESLEVSISEYHRRLAEAPARLLDGAAHAPRDYHGGLTVAKAFELAIAEAARRHAGAEQLLRAMALLAPEPIPIFLLRELAAKFEEMLGPQLAGEGLDEALAALRGFGLLSRESVPDDRDPTIATDCVRIHRLVREVATASLPADEVAAIRRHLIAAMAAAYPPWVFNTPAQWPSARRLDALAMDLVAAPAPIPDGATTEAATLLDHLASFRHLHADFVAAQALFQRALTLAETAGTPPPLFGRILNNAGLLLRDRGDLAAAAPLLAGSLAVREATLGPQHPDIAVSLNNLANMLFPQGRREEARAMLERALAIWEQALGEEDVQVASGRSNLGRILQQMGDHTRARELHDKVLAYRLRVLGRLHPDTSESFKNLALLELDLGNAAAALTQAEHGMAVAEASHGPDHPETATLRAVLARALLATGDAAGALAEARRALFVHQSSLIPQAPARRATEAVFAACLAAASP
jgi:DNA-binding winged helix-turn-helix (wHTH) protein/tetratricopeptide (TPR) repeat protein